jgi:acid phosphatase type 7
VALAACVAAVGALAADRAAAAPVIAAAGDIACPPSHFAYNAGRGTPTKCRQRATARLLYGAGYDAILPIGDLIEPKPLLKNFRRVYGPTWGRLKGITHPAVGNHEYDLGPARGYFDYFNGVGERRGPAGVRGRGWYSYDLGRWHLIALNSVCGRVGGCGGRSPQARWLRRDLHRHRRRCTLAYWHHPRFSSGAHGSEQPVGAFWRILHDHGTDVVLNGHDHLYERFAPKHPSGRRDRRRGIVQFTVGTGGRSLFSVGRGAPGSRARVEGRFGILRLRLGARRFGWRFVALGESASTGGAGVPQVLDRGARRC